MTEIVYWQIATALFAFSTAGAWIMSSMYREGEKEWRKIAGLWHKAAVDWQQAYAKRMLPMRITINADSMVADDDENEGVNDCAE